jgi:ATP-binding cassette, subfamily B, bacterial
MSEKPSVRAVEEIQYSAETDITIDGRYSVERLVVTASKILREVDGRTVLEVERSEVVAYTARTEVGSGYFEVELEGGAVVRVCRFTAARAAVFATIARNLTRIASGEPPVEELPDDSRRCPQCGRLYPEGSRICPRCTKHHALFGRLLSYTKPYGWSLLATLLLFSGVTAASLLEPRLSRAIIDRVIVPRNPDLTLLLGLVALKALLLVVRIVFVILRGRTLAAIGNGIERDLRGMVFAKIQALSLSYVSKQKTGNLMNRISADTQRIQRFIAGFASELLGSMLLIVVVLIIMVLRDWRLALLVFLPAPIVILVMRAVISVMRDLDRRLFRYADRVQHLLQDILSGIRVVKAFGREEWEIGRYRDSSVETRDLSIRANRIWNTIIPFFSFVFGFGQYFVLFFGGRLVLGEEMALGELVQFSTYAAMIYGPLAWLSQLPRMFSQMLGGAARIFEVIDEEPQIRDRPGSKRHAIAGTIVFEGVTFGYKSHEPVLDSVDLRIAPGEMIGLVGPSGAGKTTLINLLLRLYDPDEGRITIDGIDLRDLALVDLRSRMGAVLQETFLFSGSILENIRYARPEADYGEVVRAARIANAHDFIVKFPAGYDTQVGERGQRLSGGEAQRIAIARAVMHNPKILILDEATSSVDTETEQKIQDALDRLVKDRTTIAIAHRLATLRNADRLVVIDKGKIAEVGSHDELMAKRGMYYDLITTQRRMAGVVGVTG